MKTAHLVTRALGWYYAATGVLRPRRTTDRVVIGTQDQDGAAVSGVATPQLSVDKGSHNQVAIATRGCVLVSRLALHPQQASISGITIPHSLGEPTAADLTAGCAMMIYFRNQTVVFASNCGGTIQFLKIHLDGRSCTWTQNSTHV